MYSGGKHLWVPLFKYHQNSPFCSWRFQQGSSVLGQFFLGDYWDYYLFYGESPYSVWNCTLKSWYCRGVWKITFDKCVVPENIHTPTEGNGNSERKGGLKSGTFQEGGGSCLHSFFPGVWITMVRYSTYNSFSVGQAISQFTVTSVSKQVLLFSLIFVYLWSAKCFFHRLRDSFL